MNLPFRIDLSGKTAVVTGGSGVLCSRMAAALAACGAAVAIIGRRQDRAEAVAAEIEQAGGRAMGIGCDATDKAALERARALILDNLGAPSILVNGAGGNRPQAMTSEEFYSAGDFFHLDEQGIRDVFDLNYLSALLSCQVFAQDMVNREGACIVNISSMNAYRPLTKIPAYSAAKSAVSNLTQWLAVHFAPSGLRVNAIAPGFFITQQNRDMLFDADGSPTPRTQKILTATPMGRFGEPDELIGALLYLVSPEASGFVTGVVLPVDGGFSAYSGV